MARATYDYNSPDCVCGQDHNQLKFIVAQTMYDMAHENVAFESEWELGEYIAEMARRVGWVLAGDELEDLRQLTMGMTGLDQVEDAVPSVIDKKIDVSHVEPIGLAYRDGKLYLGRFHGDPVANDPDMRFVVELDAEARRALAGLLLAEDGDSE